MIYFYSFKWSSGWIGNLFRALKLLKPSLRVWFLMYLSQHGLVPGSCGLKKWPSVCMLVGGGGYWTRQQIHMCTQNSTSKNIWDDPHKVDKGHKWRVWLSATVVVPRSGQCQAKTITEQVFRSPVICGTIWNKTYTIVHRYIPFLQPPTQCTFSLISIKE